MTAYLLSQVEVIDEEAWQNYRSRAAVAIEKFGGRYLARGVHPEVVEADWEPPGADNQVVVIVEFPSLEALHAWYQSPEYAAAFAFRGKAVHRRLLFVDGVSA